MTLEKHNQTAVSFIRMPFMSTALAVVFLTTTVYVANRMFFHLRDEPMKLYAHVPLLCVSLVCSIFHIVHASITITDSIIIDFDTYVGSLCMSMLTVTVWLTMRSSHEVCLDELPPGVFIGNNWIVPSMIAFWTSSVLLYVYISHSTVDIFVDIIRICIISLAVVIMITFQEYIMTLKSNLYEQALAFLSQDTKKVAAWFLPLGSIISILHVSNVFCWIGLHTAAFISVPLGNFIQGIGIEFEMVFFLIWLSPTFYSHDILQGRLGSILPDPRHSSTSIVEAVRRSTQSKASGYDQFA